MQPPCLCNLVIVIVVLVYTCCRPPPHSCFGSEHHTQQYAQPRSRCSFHRTGRLGTAVLLLYCAVQESKQHTAVVVVHNHFMARSFRGRYWRCVHPSCCPTWPGDACGCCTRVANHTKNIFRFRSSTIEVRCTAVQDYNNNGTLLV